VRESSSFSGSPLAARRAVRKAFLKCLPLAHAINSCGEALLMSIVKAKSLNEVAPPPPTPPTRVGCELGSEGGVGANTTSFAAVGAAGASAIWFEMAVEPASPVLEHFLHPGTAAVGRSGFEPVSPALEHFLHPAPFIAESSAFELVSPALEHFLH
jgi:hypothetical protein